MPHRLRARLAQEGGYTLIELLVVVLVIGVLAAIALPVFLGQRSRGDDASAKSDAANMARQLELCAVESGSYAGCELRLTMAATGLPVGSGPGEVQIVGTPTADGYVVTARSNSGAGARTFSIARSGATVTRACAPAGDGCPVALSW